MLNQSLTAKRIFFKVFLPKLFIAGGLLVLASSPAPGQVTNGYAAERERAFQLLREGRFIEAQQIFEKLVVANSADGQVQFGLGYSLVATSKNLKDEGARRKARIRARNAFLRAKELGFQSDLLEVGLASIPPDGSESLAFSNQADVDTAMQEGEAAYTRGDYDKAIEAYQRALNLDPKLYRAAVLIGDMYFKKKMIAQAGEWYGRAITIDPDRETAYRYWSDVLLKNGRFDEARAQAVEAIIADPYSRAPYQALAQWSQTVKIAVGHPRIVPPTSTSGGTTTLALNSSDGSQEWPLYDLTRTAWQKTDFLLNHPGEKVYRHSLKEEAAALRRVAEACAKDLKSGKVKVLEPSLESLVKLNDAGLLEAYILFAHPDEGIAKDYAAYRQINRAKLRRYWLEVAILR